ncbi:hypothetical protein GE09DRAFT_148536 [Coniochaeta sp. 2T2.1]|nr:hypothetical protein GE09DRAFT_148536 [Coniochaeta sp. 2T2.1]
MSLFQEEWRRAAAARTGTPPTGAAYMSDGTSSSGSASTIPNGRTHAYASRSFTSHNTSLPRANTSLTAPPAHGNDSEDDLEVITSDLVQPVPLQVTPGPANGLHGPHGPHASSETPKSDYRYETVGGKKVMSAAAKERQSQIMKERWAAGRMDHVHEKIKQTKKRKALLQGSADDEDDPPTKKTAATSHRLSLNSDSSPLSSTNTKQPDMSGCSSSQRELWAYIYPHLDIFKHRPIPQKCWVPDLLALPRARDLKFNPRRAGSGRRPYVDTDEKKVAALLLHLTGKAASQPCSRCVNGNGAFDGCVKLSPDAGLGANIKNCANCWYSHQACIFETPSVQDAGGGIVVQDDSDHVDYEVEHEPHTDQVENEPQTDQIDPEQDNYLDRNTFPAVLLTPAGRKYHEWHDESGDPVDTKGTVLLPDQYTPDEQAEKPWWCPIDDCPRTCPTLKALSSHFPRVHYARVLNDNLDGTFSILGLYDNPKLGIGGSYLKDPPSFPYVASQKAKAPFAPLQQLKSTRSSIPAEPRIVQTYKFHESDWEDEVSRHLPEGEASKSMWEFVRPHLTKTFSIPNKGWVKELLPLPRIRDLQWNPHRKSEYYESHPRDISCLIIQVTGEKAPNPCTYCVSGKGPFDGCVVIPREAPPEVRARVVSCANCCYHNGQNTCSIINWTVGREQPPWPGYRGRGGVNGTNGVPTGKKPAPSNRHSPTKTLELDAAAGAVASLRTSAAATTTTAAVPEPQPRPNSPSQTSGSAGSRHVVEIKRPRPPLAQRADSPEIPHVRQPSAERHLEMEDWEIAPGRIRYENPGRPDDLAFAKNYLLGGPVNIHNEVQVQVEVLSSAKKRRFEPMDGKLRSCSIMVGKLIVTVDGHPEVTVGEHGQFTIRPGYGVTLQNRLYSDVVLQITTVRVYD